MLNQKSGHLVVQSSWHIKLTITHGYKWRSWDLDWGLSATGVMFFQPKTMCLAFIVSVGAGFGWRQGGLPWVTLTVIPAQVLHSSTTLPFSTTSQDPVLSPCCLNHYWKFFWRMFLPPFSLRVWLEFHALNCPLPPSSPTWSSYNQLPNHQ